MIIKRQNIMKYKLTLSIGIITTIVVYIVAAFYAADFNILVLQPMERLICGIAWAVLTALTSFIASLAENTEQVG